MFLLTDPQIKVTINWSEPGPLQGISTVIDKSSLFHFLTLWYTLGYSSEHTHLPNQEFGYRTFDCLPVIKAFPFHFTTLFIRNIQPIERLDLNSILRKPRINLPIIIWSTTSLQTSTNSWNEERKGISKQESSSPDNGLHWNLILKQTTFHHWLFICPIYCDAWLLS